MQAVPGTGRREATGAVSFLRAEIFSDGICFFALLPFGTCPSCEAPEEGAGSSSLLCKAGWVTMLWNEGGCLGEQKRDTSCQLGMRSDRGHSGPR